MKTAYALTPGAVFNPHRAFHGIWIPQWLEERHEVSEKAKKCYAYLTLFAGGKGRAWPSYNTLAEKLHVSRRHVIRILYELSRHRLIRITHVNDPVHGHQANIYEFLWHEWMQHNEDAHFKLVVPEELPPPPNDKNVTRVTPSSPPITSDIFVASHVTSPSDMGVITLVTPMSPKKNNKKRINRIKVGMVGGTPEANTAYQPDQPTNQPVDDLSIGDEEWVEILKRNHPNKDVEGELKAFSTHCQRNSSVANRRGFVGWLKKASPAVRIPERKLRYTY